MPPLRAFALVCAAFGLQGCVLAAAAIPLAAGGAILGRTLDGERTRQAMAEGTALDPDAIDPSQPLGYTVLDLTALPEPVAPPRATGPYFAIGAYTASAASGAVANAEADEAPPVSSALLADPSSLLPERAPCEAEFPAVLIDLDPAGDLMPLAAGRNADAQLVDTVSSLRRNGIAIAWITNREPTDAASIRAILRDSGLDPTARDALFVQRFPGETKQARRRALLETHCPIAIAGDERADFDDLYSYILDPTFALGLEPMIGEGWFLIPTPFD